MVDETNLKEEICCLLFLSHFKRFNIYAMLCYAMYICSYACVRTQRFSSQIFPEFLLHKTLIMYEYIDIRKLKAVMSNATNSQDSLITCFSKSHLKVVLTSSSRSSNQIFHKRFPHLHSASVSCLPQPSHVPRLPVSQMSLP